jgi:hypothetical protein
MILNDDLKGMWKEPVVAYCKALSQCLPRGTEENYKKPSQNNPFPGQNLKLILPKHEMLALTTIL